MVSIDKSGGISNIGFTDQEIQSLNQQHIQTVNDLWSRIGGDFDNGITNLARDAKIDQDRLIKVLADLGRREAKRRRPESRALLLPLGVVIVFYLVGLVRLFLMGHYPVVLAANDLQSGQVVRANDLMVASLPREDDYFTATSQLEGLVLAQNISKKTPVRFQDVLRPQIVASSDILRGTLISRETISITWSLYQPDATLFEQQVVGHQALRSIEKGQVIPHSSVAGSERGVVVSLHDLAPFQMIDVADVQMQDLPYEPGAWTSIEDILGRYPLVQIPKGTILHIDQLNWVPPDLVGRRIVAVTPVSTTLTPDIRAGTRVTLLVSPTTSQSRSQPLAISNVIVLAVEPMTHTTEVTVALKEYDYEALRPLLGKSQFYVVASPH